MLLLRRNKAAPLTNEEVDDNFLYLEKLINDLQNTKLSTANLLLQTKNVDGAGSGLDADTVDGMQPTELDSISSIVKRDGSGNFSANVITANLNGNALTASSAAGITGVLSFLHGGTGTTSLTSGYVKSTGSVLTAASSIAGSDVVGDIGGDAANVTGIVSIPHGGTGATNSIEAAAALGIVIGQTVQAYSPNLQYLSQLNGFGIVCQSSMLHTRVLEVGNGLTLTNADGATGNPRIDISVIPIANGGTGANTSQAALSILGGAPIQSPAFQGTPTAATAPFGTNTNQIATTAFVINNRIPAGTVLFVAHLIPPNGFLACDGMAYFIVDYPDLYAVLGTRFGDNGVGTFRTPGVVPPVMLIAVIKT